MDRKLIFDVGMNNGDDTAYYLSRSRYGPPSLNVWHDVHARLGGEGAGA